MQQVQIFHYKTGNSFLHKMPPALKIFILLLFAVLAFRLSLNLCFLGWILALFCSILLKFTVKELFADLKPTIIYFFLMYTGSIITNLIILEEKTLQAVFTLSLDYLLLFARLAFSLSITSLLYRTTSSVQFYLAFAQIERFFKKKEETPFADTISLTLGFIPSIIETWTHLENVWKAREGKNSIKKLIKLVPLLFSVSLNNAYNKSLAIENRK